MKQQHDVTGAFLAGVLDYIKASLSDPEAWNLAIYVGHKDDPANAYIVGNIEPEALIAGAQSLLLDGERVGTVNRDGRVTE